MPNRATKSSLATAVPPNINPQPTIIAGVIGSEMEDEGPQHSEERHKIGDCQRLTGANILNEVEIEDVRQRPLRVQPVPKLQE